MILEDLVGAELLECHFGKVWIRLVFSKSVGANNHVIWLDTDNFVTNKIVDQYGTDSIAIARELSSVVFDNLERKVESLKHFGKSVEIDFNSTSRIFICPDSDSIDNLFKLSNRATMEWLVVG